ncbi:Centromere/kinetochore protein zw10 -like protein [Trichinella papuae]|uniref:Centromere/kinetochore protein zw10-like protein n=1 Tax=Trichinella papuae TaxID=268474 RepID=A0A0V1M7M8_9BILA|nr:Centromere/kinetochore protein zw10 -like protein [Trichinella papuae]
MDRGCEFAELKQENAVVADVFTGDGKVLQQHRLESRLREALAENENCGKDVASANVDEAAVCCAKVNGSEEEGELKFYNDLFERFHRLYNDYDTISNSYDDSSDGFVWDYCQRTIMNDISRMGEILMVKTDLISLKTNGNVSLKSNTETPEISCLRTLEEKWSLVFWLKSNSEIVELKFAVSYVDTFYATQCLLLSSMQLLNERWNAQFPFVKHLQDLRREATLQFQTYVNNCSTIVNKYLKSLEEFDDLLDNDCIKEYRASLDLLYVEYEQWKIKWQQNLPKKIWQAAIGQLISISTEFFCNTILKIDNFTNVIRKNVKSLISPFISKCRTLFEIDTSEEIETVCKDWQRLNEMLFIIHSSVNEVEIRWGNDSGPLVLHLTAEELNKLLSANFQNTRLLKKLLSKIK